MFPYIRLYSPFRHYMIGFIFIALIGLQTSLLLFPTQTPLQSKDPRLADVIAYEDLLSQKAELVLKRFGADSYAIDLSVVLDHTTITITTFDPGSGSQKLPATQEKWQEEVSTSPRVRHIKVCVTIPKQEQIDQDQLFRSLSYSLGIDLSRGDMLRLVFL